jgi:hypothetical protein
MARASLYFARFNRVRTNVAYQFSKQIRDGKLRLMAAPVRTVRQRRPIGRIVLSIFAVLLVVHLLLSAALYAAMTRPPDQFGRIMMRVPFPLMIVLPFESLWKHARAGSLRTGDEAPDFRLPTLDRTQMVQLSSFRGSRPVVLVFGSYT